MEFALVRDLDVVSASVFGLAVAAQAAAHVAKICRVCTSTTDRRLTVIGRACSRHKVIRGRLELGGHVRSVDILLLELSIQVA